MDFVLNVNTIRLNTINPQYLAEDHFRFLKLTEISSVPLKETVSTYLQLHTNKSYLGDGECCVRNVPFQARFFPLITQCAAMITS